MNKKLSTFLLASFLLIGCSSGGSESSPTWKGKHIINGFNSIKEMYTAQQMVEDTSHDLNERLDITNDPTYVLEGEGALSVTYNKSYGGYAHSYIIQRIDISPISESPINDINDFGVSIYNANEVDTKADLVLFDKSQKVICSETFDLPKGQYSHLKIDLSKLLMDASYENVLGFGIGVNYLIEAQYYIDEWYVDFGLQYNADDLVYLDVVKDIENRIDQLPSINSIDFIKDTETVSTIESIGEDYYKLPVVYQNAVNNASVLLEMMDSYLYQYYTAHKSDNTLEALKFESSFGQRQVKLLSSYSGISYSYDTEHKIAGERGSLMMSYNGSNPWSYTKWLLETEFTDFTRFAVSVYNDTDDRVAICLNWCDVTIIAPHSWQKIDATVEECRNKNLDYIELEVSTLDPVTGNGGVNGVKGKLYFSSVYMFR